MSGDDRERAPQSRNRWRYGPLRLVLLWVAVVFGAVQTIRAATGDVGSVFLYIGPALVVLGLVAFFVYRWMAKRGV